MTMVMVMVRVMMTVMMTVTNSIAFHHVEWFPRMNFEQYIIVWAYCRRDQPSDYLISLLFDWRAKKWASDMFDWMNNYCQYSSRPRHNDRNPWIWRRRANLMESNHLGIEESFLLNYSPKVTMVQWKSKCYYSSLVLHRKRAIDLNLNCSIDMFGKNYAKCPILDVVGLVTIWFQTIHQEIDWHQN